jgi:cell division FtsZ-interacting protein ZapD
MTVVLVSPARATANQTMDLQVVRIAEAIAATGRPARVLESGSSTFLSDLVMAGADPQATIYLGSYFSDLRISASQQFVEVNILDSLQARLFGLMSDHPYSDFVFERSRLASSNVTQLVTDPCFEASARLINPQLERFAPVRANIFYGDLTEPREFQDRDIDLLVPLSFEPDHMSTDTVLDVLKDAAQFRSLFSATLAEMREQPTADPMGLLAGLARAQQQFDLADFAKAQTKAFLGFAKLLGVLDRAWRAERRSKILKDLLRDTADLRIVVTCPPIEGGHRSANVDFVGAVSAKTLGALMARARVTINVNPSYPNYVHDRIVNAMAAGSAVVSDWSAGLEKAFDLEREIHIWSPGRSAASLVGDRSPTDWEAMAIAGQQAAVQSFGLDQTVAALTA